MADSRVGKFLNPFGYKLDINFYKLEINYKIGYNF